MRILLLTAHSIAEFDDLRMLHELGHEVLSIGAYLDPANPQDDKRPALPHIPPAPAELRDLVADQMVAKSDLPDAVLDWAEVVICHHFPDAAPDGRAGWLTGNWRKYRAHGNRVIWRTCGQSSPDTEWAMAQLRADGLQIVRYSPKESAMPGYAGADTLIRFGKEPEEWGDWVGDQAVVGNVTQHMAQRGNACGYEFWKAATDGLPTSPAGPGSEAIGGVGPLTYDGLREYLRRIRVYLYTGTRPASYTLGLIEAMMTGVPVVSIGPQTWGGGWGGEGLFEGHDLTRAVAYPDSLPDVSWVLSNLLREPDTELSGIQRRRAISLFGVAAVSEQWRAFLA